MNTSSHLSLFSVSLYVSLYPDIDCPCVSLELWCTANYTVDDILQRYCPPVCPFV